MNKSKFYASPEVTADILSMHRAEYAKLKARVEFLESIIASGNKFEFEINGNCDECLLYKDIWDDYDGFTICILDELTEREYGFDCDEAYNKYSKGFKGDCNKIRDAWYLDKYGKEFPEYQTYFWKKYARSGRYMGGPDCPAIKNGSDTYVLSISPKVTK